MRKRFLRRTLVEIIRLRGFELLQYRSHPCAFVCALCSFRILPEVVLDAFHILGQILQVLLVDHLAGDVAYVIANLIDQGAIGFWPEQAEKKLYAAAGRGDQVDQGKHGISNRIHATKHGLSQGARLDGWPTGHERKLEMLAAVPYLLHQRHPIGCPALFHAEKLLALPRPDVVRAVTGGQQLELLIGRIVVPVPLDDTHTIGCRLARHVETAPTETGDNVVVPPGLVKLKLLILATDPIALLDRHASLGFAVMDFDNLPAVLGN